MTLTPDIVLLLVILALTITAFVREWMSMDVVALTCLALLLLFNLVTPEGFNVTISPKKIAASSDVQRLVQRTIADIPVTLTHIPNGMSVHLEPSVISITITGGEKYLASLQKDNFSVYADYRRAQGATDNRINARINLPPEVELTGAKPQTFRVVTEG